MRNIDLRSSYEDIYESEQIDEAIPAVLGAAAKAAVKPAMKAAATTAATNLADRATRKKETNEEVEVLDEEGKKDACYHKVKSRYNVWPSAYASGALVKCRQKGAKNWGNSSKKEEYIPEDKAGKVGYQGQWVDDSRATRGYSVNDDDGAPKDTRTAEDRKKERAEAEKKAEAKRAPAKKREDEARARLNKDIQLRNARKKLDAMKKNESYTAAYMEGYKKLPAAKMQDKAAMKPDTARGEKQARKMDLVRNATKGNEDLVKQVTKGQEMANKKRGLERRFAMPSAKNAEQKKAKNMAYKLENQRRKDLDKRYGPKKEELEAVYAFLLGEGIAWNEESAINILNHMSDEWYDSIVEGILSESDYPLRDAMNAAGMNRAPKAAPIKPAPKKPAAALPKKGMA